MDGFILETFSDLHEVEAALCAVKALTELPIVAQMTVGHDGNTSYGTAPETFTKQLDEWGADVIGLNCSVGPHTMLEAIEAEFAALALELCRASWDGGMCRHLTGTNVTRPREE